MPKLMPGCLVLYKTKAASIRSSDGIKLEIDVAGGGSKSVRPKDVLFLHAGPAGALPPAELPVPDCVELSALMEGEKLSFADFVPFAYNEDTPEAAWSAYRLLTEGIYFAGSPEDGVSARPEAEVKQILASRLAREQAADAHAALLERIRSGNVDTETDKGAFHELEQVAEGVISSSRLMRDLNMEALPENAHKLLLKLRVWDDLHNPFPARAGVELSAPAFPLDGVCSDDTRRDMTGVEAYAIDDDGSADPDDAVAFADGCLLVHVADPGSALVPGGEADLEARNRGQNLYLPTGVIPMLPEEATARFGLGLQEASPAWTFVIAFEDDGRPFLKDFFPSTVRVSRHNYDSAGALLEGPLAPAAALLAKFKDFRKAQGALFIRMPEVKVRVSGGDIAIESVVFSPVREVVAHAMLAAGAAVARYAEEKALAMPFVIQPPAELEQPPEEDAPLHRMYETRRACAPGCLSILPGRHSGLGLNPYVRVTSPLRRYEDLLAHRQLRRVFRGEEPMTPDEMESAFVPSEEAALVRTRLERQVNEFYKTVWFQRHPDWHGEAVALQNLDGVRTACMLPEFAYEFKTRYGNGELVPGKRYPVSLALADPVSLLCRFRFGKDDPAE